MTADPLLRFRPEFPILEKTTYLISNSLGAMPRAAADALATADEELDSAFAAIDEIFASGEWRRWTNQPAVVT
jgi:kynureninase